MPMKPRKIVQVFGEDDDGVLADDGSLWRIEGLYKENQRWVRIEWPPLPPIEEPEGEEKV